MESLRDSTRSTSIQRRIRLHAPCVPVDDGRPACHGGDRLFRRVLPGSSVRHLRQHLRLIILAIAVFAMPLVLSGMISRLSAFAATALFVVYSALMGAFLSSVLLVYTGASVMSTFVTCAAMFGGMSIYGTVTKRDLTGMGSFMMMGLFG